MLSGTVSKVSKTIPDSIKTVFPLPSATKPLYHLEDTAFSFESLDNIEIFLSFGKFSTNKCERTKSYIQKGRFSMDINIKDYSKVYLFENVEPST
jgi:hypothetical protein